MRFLFKVAITVFLVSLSAFCNAGELRLRYSKYPLSEVLVIIRDQTSLSLSFNQGELSKYKITVDSTFADGLSAIRFLVKEFPLNVNIVNGVIVISHKADANIIGGIISDKESGERLPFANILFDNRVYISDENGYFRLPAKDIEGLKFSFRYLGYRQLDTTLSPGTGSTICLKSTRLEIKELLFEDYETGKALQNGDQPGLIRINHAIAQYLPGNGDNSVFNLLRLMPGIRATGEPSGLSVWGSRPGESSVIFDGSRLFSMSGFNEQISSINPYMVKEIRLMKGGYGPQYGNQTGGIAEIVGINGNRTKPEFKLNLNNLTANIFGSVPVGKRATISAAYRQTYYGLYDVNILNPYGKRGANQASSAPGNGKSSGNNQESIYVTPDYNFRDANLKLSGDLSDNSHYYISLYGASDKFEYSISGDEFSLNAFDRNNQISASAGLDKNWKGGASSGIYFKYSALDNNSSKAVRLNRENYYTIDTDNIGTETGAKMRHSFSVLSINNIETGIGADNLSDVLNDSTSKENKFNFYINDRINLRKISFDLGLRGDMYKQKFYIQPRFSLKYNVLENLSLSASWGIYNQFLGKVPIIYDKIAPALIWKVLGEENYPVMGSVHSIISFSYSNKAWLISLEGYNKNNRGLTQIFRSGNLTSVENGQSVITGADLFLKWEKKGSQVFGAFSLAKMTETYDTKTVRTRSSNPLEIKFGALWNLNPFFLSASFVYGNGYVNTFGIGRYSNLGGEDYSRFDISATYSFKIKKSKFRTGLSVLNILNTSNAKTLDILPSPNKVGQNMFLNLYSESIPFTPTIYLEIDL
ncbi:MAG: TonB-dependent receptor [Bacteroidales bacterium]|nr:TonB-dependent receptor [Bacteroidales bacterium]